MRNSYERQASVNPDSPAAIFYTSGTTGQPKAATLTNFGYAQRMSHAVIAASMVDISLVFVIPTPMFHILAEAIGVLNVAVSNCKIDLSSYFT